MMYPLVRELAADGIPVAVTCRVLKIGTEALVGGPLTMAGGCLLLGGFPVVWPYGTTWDPDAEAVRLPDGQMASVGDRVSGGGGFPYLSDLGPELAEPLADCPLNEHGEIAMFNAVEQITVTN